MSEQLMHCHTCDYRGRYSKFKFVEIDLALCPKCGSKTGDCNVL